MLSFVLLVAWGVGKGERPIGCSCYGADIYAGFDEGI